MSYQNGYQDGECGLASTPPMEYGLACDYLTGYRDARVATEVYLEVWSRPVLPAGCLTDPMDSVEFQAV